MARPTAVVVSVAVATIAALAVVAVPYLTRDRDYPAEIVQPAPLLSTSVVGLRPGSEACFGDAVIEPHSEQARFRVGTRLRKGAPLDLAIRGEGYSHSARIPGGYPDNELLAVAVPPPERATAVRICIANRGRHPMDIYAAGDRTRGRTRTFVDGRPAPANISFSFWEAAPRSLWERLPASIDRLAVFRPAFVGPWLLWPLAVLFAVGVPAAVLWGFARSLRD